MADSGLHVMPFEVRAKPRAKIVRGDGLTNRTDIVALTLDREQHGPADCARRDPLPAPREFAQRQRVFLKD